MDKKEMLRKAFSQAAANAAANFADEDIDFLVLKSEMEEFAKKHNVEVTESEIGDYIKEQFKNFHEMTKDFDFPEKI